MCIRIQREGAMFIVEVLGREWPVAPSLCVDVTKIWTYRERAGAELRVEELGREGHIIPTLFVCVCV